MFAIRSGGGPHHERWCDLATSIYKHHRENFEFGRQHLAGKELEWCALNRAAFGKASDDMDSFINEFGFPASELFPT